MTNLEEIDKVADLWNKTREWSYGKNINNTNTTVRWNVSKREVRFGKTDGGA